MLLQELERKPLFCGLVSRGVRPEHYANVELHVVAEVGFGADDRDCTRVLAIVCHLRENTVPSADKMLYTPSDNLQQTMLPDVGRYLPHLARGSEGFLREIFHRHLIADLTHEGLVSEFNVRELFAGLLLAAQREPHFLAVYELLVIEF